MLRLAEEAWRHAKAIAAWDAGVTVLEQAGIAGTPGVITAKTATEALTGVQEPLAAHRVWERFPASLQVRR